MSTSKIVRSKRKALIPSEISMSVNTPKSRKFLFPSEPVSGNTRESEKEDETTGIKKSKKKKIRKTQNFLEFLDETDGEVHARVSVSPKRSTKTLFVESGDTESSEVSADKPKSVTKSKKKKIKFPEVVLDDLEVFDNSDKCSLSDKRKKLKRQQSVDSNSSSTLEVIKTDKELKRTRKSRKSKDVENEENAKSVKTRSAKKLHNQETPDETINTANKSRKSADNLLSINKTSQSTDSEQSGENNEVTLTNCASSVDEDKETNTQSSGKKNKKRSKKLSKENFDPSDTVIKTRSSRKRHRETFDNDEGTVNEKGTQIDSEKTEEGNKNLEVDENSATSTVTENDGIEVQSKKRKKRSKKSDPKHNEDTTITQITRNSRRRTDRKSNNVNGEDLDTLNDIKTNGDLEKNALEDVAPTYSSVDEEESKLQSSSKKTKKKKKSKNNYEADETIKTKRQSLGHQNDRTIEDEQENSDSKTNDGLNSEENGLNEDGLPTNSSVDENEEVHISAKKRKNKKKSTNKHVEDETINTKRQSLRHQNDKTIEDEKENSELKTKNTMNSEENVFNDDFLPTNTSGDENEEVQISAKKRKNKKKSNNKHVEDETLNTKRKSLRRQSNRTIEDEEENSELKTNNRMNSEENVLNEDVLPTNSSVDENEEVQISAKKRKNKKKSNNKHVEDETTNTKRQSLRRQSDMKIKDEKENVQFNNELNYQTRHSNTNENILSSVEDILLEVRNCSSVNQEAELQTSTRKRKRSRISDYKQNPDKTLTSKIHSESEDNKESGNTSIDQIEESKESTMNKNNYLMPVNENIHFNGQHFGSVDADDEMEYPTSAKKKKRTTRSSRKQDETFTETQTSRKSEKRSEGKESYEKELGNELTDSLEMYINANGNEEIKVPVEECCSPVDDDDVVQDTSVKERNISKRTTLDCNEENQELSKFESSENKENLKAENQSMVESSRSSRKSRRTFSFGLTEDKTGEGELKNDIKSFTDQGLNVIDRPEEFPSITDGNRLEAPVPARKSSTGRKRWSKVPEKVELFLPVSNETSNASCSVNLSSQRRSVRKRWSSELKKKFDSMRKDNDPLLPNNGVSEEYSFATEGQNRNDISQSSSNISSDSPILMKRIDYLDSPMPVYAPSAFDSINKKLDETFTPEKSEQDSFTRRSSKRLSKSLDLSEGVSVLEQTVTVENEALKFSNYNPECSFKRLSNKSPASILKRRDTYDVDQSITDVSVLRSLSENDLSDPGLIFKQDDCESVKKNVRFQHVTVRRGAVRKDDPHTPENKVEPNNLQVTTDKKSALKSGAANKSVSFDQTMFSTSSLASSTPLHSLRKNTLMKQTMRREKLSNVANINRRSRSVETKRDKYVNRIRMPNFTKIHQKAMERVEDISEMAKRKAERARLLLSGQKPTANTGSAYSQTQEKNIIHAKQPKQLKFTKSQPVTNHPTKETTSTAVTNKISKVAVQAKVDTSKTKDAKTLPGVVSKFTNPSKKKETAPSKLLVGRSVIADKLQTLKTNPSQFGALKRAEQIKTIVTKSKPTKVDDREERRIVVKGVRGNRRFDLLMEMRNRNK